VQLLASTIGASEVASTLKITANIIVPGAIATDFKFHGGIATDGVADNGGWLGVAAAI
jgi:hypothetical protein